MRRRTFENDEIWVSKRQSIIVEHYLATSSWCRNNLYSPVMWNTRANSFTSTQRLWRVWVWIKEAFSRYYEPCLRCKLILLVTVIKARNASSFFFIFFILLFASSVFLFRREEALIQLISNDKKLSTRSVTARQAGNGENFWINYNWKELNKSESHSSAFLLFICEDVEINYLILYLINYD